MTNPILLPTGASVALASPAPPKISATPPAPSSVVIVPVQGPPGQRGPAGNNSPVFDEIPTGVQDGTNTAFTVANSFQPNTTRVYRNGLREQLNVSYTEASPQIIFSTPPLPDDVLTVDYLIA